MTPNVYENIEVSIVTHATKILPELGRKDTLKYPGAPKTELLSDVIKNIKTRLGLSLFNIVFDHKIDCNISQEYLENLRTFCKEEGLRLVISPSASRIPSQITATNAFNLAVRSARSNYVMLWEHDHLFGQDVEWDLIQLAFDSGAEMLRFNRRENKSTMDQVPEQVSRLSISERLCRTDYYCNGPFIARRDWVQDLFQCTLSSPPSFSGPFGAFIEGPINQIMMRDRFNIDDQEYYKKYPIFLYGGVGEQPIVSHFGDFPGRRARWSKKLRQMFLPRAR
jgi:hypothetical protein